MSEEGVIFEAEGIKITTSHSVFGANSLLNKSIGSINIMENPRKDGIIYNAALIYVLIYGIMVVVSILIRIGILTEIKFVELLSRFYRELPAYVAVSTLIIFFIALFIIYTMEKKQTYALVVETADGSRNIMNSENSAQLEIIKAAMEKAIKRSRS